MRKLLAILAAIAIGVGISYWQWGDLLDPSLPPLPPEPTIRQRQFGPWITPRASAAMERKLPDDFVTPKTLDPCLAALARAGKMKVFAGWDQLGEVGVARDSPVEMRFAGAKLGDALIAIAGAHNPPLMCVADDDLIAVTLTTPDAVTTLVEKKVLAVSDLASTPAEEQQLIAELQANVAPGAWSPVGGRGSRMMFIGYQLNVIARRDQQYDVARYLNDRRLRRSQLAFAYRAGLFTMPLLLTTVAVIVMLHLRSRRLRRLEGCCRNCGYDLRASPDRCPECGIQFTSFASPRTVASSS